MGRRIIYKIPDDGKNKIVDEEWDDIGRLQHWYNSEFRWSTGRIAFRRFVMFENFDEFSENGQPRSEIIRDRMRALRKKGLAPYQIAEILENDQLVTVKWGGYYDGCLASGFTRVADNEWNAYLVCDFLLKASRITRNASIEVEDEGRFLKTRRAVFHHGEVRVRETDLPPESSMVGGSPRVFSVVDSGKYDRHRRLRNSIPEFKWLKADDRRSLLEDWNWLGYDDRYDANGDDHRGTDLNDKVVKVRVQRP